MKMIVITAEEPLPNEAGAVNELFRAGLPLLHLRRPRATRDELEAWIESVEPEFRQLIVLHDHHSLAAVYGLRGIHLNGRNPLLPAVRGGLTISRSCHTLTEITEWIPFCDYLFLSPVYDSLSKKNYSGAFTPEILRQAADAGTIGPKVFALGGVTPKHLPELAALGFGGVVILGSLWADYALTGDRTALLERMKTWIKTLETYERSTFYNPSDR